MQTTINRYDIPKGLPVTGYKILKTWKCKSTNPDSLQLVVFRDNFYLLEFGINGFCFLAKQIFFTTNDPVAEFEADNLDRIVV